MKVVVVSESAFSVQGHGVHTAFIETVNALRSAGIDVAVNSFDRAQVRHIHTVGPYSLAHLLIGSGRKVVSAHVVPDSFVGSLIGAKHWYRLAAWYLTWFYNRAAVVIAVSDATKKALIDLGVKSPIEVVYNMVDTAAYRSSSEQKQTARSKLGFNETDFIVVGNGQVQPRKRVDSFIELARQLPDTKFVWIGGIPFKHVAADYKKMNQMIADAPKNVTVTGTIPKVEVVAYFKSADVFLLPSEQETFGLAVVEAAASGLPIVLRDINDYNETFREDSILCSEDQFFGVIEKLKNDKDYYLSAQQFAANIATRFDSKTIIKQLLEIYRQDGK